MTTERTAFRAPRLGLQFDSMNLAEYKARRGARAAAAPAHRPTCPRCRKALPTCYCVALRPFVSPVPFVILQHSHEARNPIATARMAHLSMTNSLLIEGRSFASDARVEALIADEAHRDVLLFPSADAAPIERVFAGAETDPRPVRFWILDARWAQIPKMLRLSPNVRALPRAAFVPERPSAFQIRRQPDPAYVSTIETAHLVIERHLQWHGARSDDHQALLDVFAHLVKQQQEYAAGKVSRHVRAKAARAERRSSKPLDTAADKA
jgi:DTW domain-containing protein YfiP